MPLKRIRFLKTHILLYYSRLYRIIWYSDLKFTQFFISQAALFFGVLLLMPQETLNRPVYELIHTVFTDVTLASLFLMHGCVSTYSLLQNTYNKFTFVFDGILGCFLWNMFIISILIGTYPPPLLPGELCLAITSWLLLARYNIKKDNV